jgi:hypothetical protein
MTLRTTALGAPRVRYIFRCFSKLGISALILLILGSTFSADCSEYRKSSIWFLTQLRMIADSGLLFDAPSVGELLDLHLVYQY